MTEANLDNRVIIIDSPTDVSPFLGRLKANGVRVIGRYYARKPQPELGMPKKRIIDNKSGDLTEAELIKRHGINILSVYQYYSGGTGDKFFHGRPDTKSPEKEAEADASAALDQARAVGQPARSVIYFGVDFDCKEGAKGPHGRDQIDYILDYFNIIQEKVSPHYRIGAYANGYVNEILRGEGKTQFAWVSPSLAYCRTPSYLRTGDWNLYQNQVDRLWFANADCQQGLDVDTNLQRRPEDIGFWGGDPLSSDRVSTVYELRRPAIKKTAVYKNADAAELIAKKRCVSRRRVVNGKRRWVWEMVAENSVARLHNVRVVSVQGDWLHVDIDDDGAPDGFCRSSDFARSIQQIGDW